MLSAMGINYLPKLARCILIPLGNSQKWIRAAEESQKLKEGLLKNSVPSKAK